MKDKNLNVVFIAVDTLRADHLSCYGYHRKTSPEIDEFANEGVLFYNAFAPAIPTQPSFTTMLTGVHPINHGIVCHDTKVALSPEIPMLPQMLKKHGYVTAAVDNLATAYSNVPWFIRGYDYYIDSGGKKVISFGAKIFAEKVNNLAINWIKNWRRGERGDKPFFMFLHYWDPHAPYWPPTDCVEKFYKGNPKDTANKSLEKIRESPGWVLAWVEEPLKAGITDKVYVEALYDGEIAYVSSQIGELLSTLKEMELTENTLIVLTADHGEGMGEHGVYYDHHNLYEFNIRIPLIMVFPDRLPPKRRVENMVQHIDIVPTILDLLKIPKTESVDGTSLLPIISGVEEGYSKIICLENTRMTKRAMRTREWKLIETLRPDFYGHPAGWIELYNMKQDPDETENLAESEEKITHDLLARLEIWTRSKLKEREDPLLSQKISMPPPTHPDQEVRDEIAKRQKKFTLRLNRKYGNDQRKKA